jgi:hypothetical protein
MKRLAPLGLLAAMILLAAAGASPSPAFAACAQAADGRCAAPGEACNPPADGRCHTMPAPGLSRLAHACRCVSPRQFGPHAAAPGQKSCRQTCNAREITCDSSARTFTQRNNCSSRFSTCNSHC